MTQIYGRCRGEYKILSDTIVYNTKDYALVEDMRTYPDSLVRKAAYRLCGAGRTTGIADRRRELECDFLGVEPPRT